jgi:hypothetical protein
MNFKLATRLFCRRCREAENARRKLEPRFHGPYKIIEVVSPVAYRLELPASYRIHPVVHISHLKVYRDDSSDFPSRPAYAAPPPPIVVDGEEYSIIEQIVKHRIYGPKSKSPVAQFYVKWQGYGNEENSWLSASQLWLDMPAEFFDAMIKAYVDRSGARLDARHLDPPLPRGVAVSSLIWIE